MLRRLWPKAPRRRSSLPNTPISRRAGLETPQPTSLSTRLDATSFDAVGGLLVEAQSLEEQVRGLQAVFDAGIVLDNYLRHLQVRIYGDAAVVTGYITGTETNPDGSVVQTMNRRTAVLIRQGGEWKEVHSHASPVVGAE